MIEFITEQLKGNAFVSGGAALMILGAIAAYLRRIPGMALRALGRYYWIELTLMDYDGFYHEFLAWLSTQRTPFRQRNLQLRSVNRSDEKVSLDPGPGTHLYMFGKRPMFVTRKRDEPKQNSPTVQSVHVKLLARSDAAVRELISAVETHCTPEPDSKIKIITWRHGEWRTLRRINRRPLESVVWKNGDLEHFVDDVKLFQKREAWYGQRSIPYRRGYLLEGPPGNGKSSVALALASELGMDIGIIALSDRTLTDTQLQTALAEAPPKSVIVVEDIDCAFKERHGDEKAEGITFSGLLNAIDGIGAGEGRILLMTTNHLDRLDPALKRPGRADLIIHVGNADRDQAERMFLRFFPGSSLAQTFASSSVPGALSMAQLQAHLLKYADDPETAAANPVDGEIIGDGIRVPASGIGIEKAAQMMGCNPSEVRRLDSNRFTTRA